ncbi:dTMP kinase [Limobrevibacterium gyesilva]|uniref:Thymidylate kinase n=1 Tax=Limobrevibacterium gyesilva TaxID=2991712 RepID=A0AA41YQT3_9PROT|nr:dTMP kinase [Limobrevibacterium gyesilva]
MDSKGRFITLEGGEGAGKSTQARRLADALAREGVPVLRTREPGGAPGAEVLRRLLLDGEIAWSPPAETLLHFAARAEHVERTIRPALDAGMWVVCDRFADSTMVYQGYGQGADRADIAALTDMLGLRPDLTLVLDVTVPTSLARLAQRGSAADRYESLGEVFFARIRDGFRAVAEGDPARCVLIEAESEEDDVARTILATVLDRLCDPSSPPPLVGLGRGADQGRGEGESR